jgi:hypothetical protein
MRQDLVVQDLEGKVAKLKAKVESFIFMLYLRVDVDGDCREKSCAPSLLPEICRGISFVI